MQVMEDTMITTTEARIAAILGAVAASYGARHAAHRFVMMHSLARGGGGNRLSPLMTKLIEHLSNERQSGAVPHAIRGADAFVLAHALAGVLRAMISEGDAAPPQDEIAQALTRLVLGLVQ